MLRALEHIRHVLYAAQWGLDYDIKGLGITLITSIHNNHNCGFFFCVVFFFAKTEDLASRFK